jgi:hypothetical protein
VQATITLKEVLAFMDTGEEFDMAFVTDDENRGTGGEWIEVKNVHKTEYVTKVELAKMNRAQPQMEVLRNPNHYPNSTRNIVFRSGEVRTIAIRLIRRFNGKTVM